MRSFTFLIAALPAILVANAADSSSMAASRGALTMEWQTGGVKAAGSTSLSASTTTGNSTKPKTAAGMDSGMTMTESTMRGSKTPEATPGGAKVSDSVMGGVKTTGSKNVTEAAASPTKSGTLMSTGKVTNTAAPAMVTTNAAVPAVHDIQLAAAAVAVGGFLVGLF